ncbi:MAG: hypothetical protein GF349_03620 [Candidatus Magasanikbacteria bacterium]|nr:hypothetical protein [Candidatus Magasanikbacteria bacterium]
MKKIILIILSLLIFLGIIVVMTIVFRYCPPEGPWPMPPWCETEIKKGEDAQIFFTVSVPYNTDISKGIKLDISDGQVLDMIQISDLTYQAVIDVFGQEKIKYNYRSESGVSEDMNLIVNEKEKKVFDGVSSWSDQGFEPDLNMVLGADMADTWGRNYNFEWFEDTRNNVESSFGRLSELGVQETGARDFFWVKYDGEAKDRVDVKDSNFYIEEEIFWNDQRDEAMTQEDMDKLVKQAHDRDMEIVWRSNLHFNNIGAYITSGDIVGGVGSDFDRLAQDKSREWVEAFFAQWARVLNHRAQMLKKSGFDTMIITPGWHNPSFHPYEELANKRWKETINSLQNYFEGNIGVIIDRYSIMGEQSGPDDWNKYDYYRQADMVYMDIFYLPGAYQVQPNPNIEEMKKAFDRYLDDIETRARELDIQLSLNLGFSSFKDSVNYEGFHEFYEFYKPEVTSVEADWQHQADIYEAFMRSLEGRDFIERITILGYWWDDAMDPEVKPRISINNSIRNKTAEAVIDKWFGAANN